MASICLRLNVLTCGYYIYIDPSEYDLALHAVRNIYVYVMRLFTNIHTLCQIFKDTRVHSTKSVKFAYSIRSNVPTSTATVQYIYILWSQMSLVSPMIVDAPSARSGGH